MKGTGRRTPCAAVIPSRAGCPHFREQRLARVQSTASICSAGISASPPLTLHSGHFLAGEFHKGPSMRLEKRGDSSGHRVLCPYCELSLLTFLPSKSADVNNSGRFSITLILSSKWLALKILKIKQQKYYFCPEKNISTLLFLSAAFWPISSRAPLLCALWKFSPPGHPTHQG